MPLTMALPGAGVRRAPATQEEFAKSRCTGFERAGQQETGALHTGGSEQQGGVWEMVINLPDGDRPARGWQPSRTGLIACVLIRWESRAAPLQPGNRHCHSCWGTGVSRAETASQQVREKEDVCTPL